MLGFFPEDMEFITKPLSRLGSVLVVIKTKKVIVFLRRAFCDRSFLNQEISIKIALLIS